MDIIFNGVIQGGQVNVYDKRAFKTLLQKLEAQDVEIIVRKPHKIRTHRQNAYYWACIVGIPAEHFGYLPEEMHDAYKMIFLRNHEEGKPETIKSTTKLTTKEFSEYVEKCRQWAAEQGIYIPDADRVEIQEEYVHA